MEHTNEIKSLLQTISSELCIAKRFAEAFMLKAQKLGLQGEKRRLRYNSAKYHNLINYFRCDAYDLYGIDLSISVPETTVPTVGGIQEFLQQYLTHVGELYDKLHSLANNLVGANGQNYACCLYDKCRSLTEEIKYYRRTIQEGTASGWKPEFMFLHQTTDCNIHDSFEEKEKSVGYDY